MPKSCAPLLAFGLVGLLAWPHAHQDPDDLTGFLHDELGFDSGEIENLQGGDAIARALDERSDEPQVTLAGAIRLRTSRDELKRRFEAIADFVRGETTPEAGRLGRRPKLDDLHALTLPEDDLESLADCQVGECEVKLPAADIQGFRARANSNGSGAEARKLFLEMLIRDARAYLKRGSAALPVYADKPEPLSVAGGLDTLLQGMPYLRRFAPEFGDHLAGFPHRRLAGADDFLYWAKETFGLKPVVTLNHASIYAPASDPRRLLMATAQIYATHYFQGGLRLIVLVQDADARGDAGPAADAAGADEPNATLLYLESWRFDGPLGGIQRHLLTGRLEGDLRKRLSGIRDALERDDGSG